METMQKDYPWTKAPLITSAPMRLISTAKLAVAVSQAGGLGFIGAGNDVSELEAHLAEVRSLLKDFPLFTHDVLPVGIGFLIWGAPLTRTVSILVNLINRPAAVWLFAPKTPADYNEWTTSIRAATSNHTKIWIQIGSVADALSALDARPDVLVVQGQDAGGHGSITAAGLIPLVAEVARSVRASCATRGQRVPQLAAAGGIADGSTVAAALSLGAASIVAGTAYLAADEANLAKGYRDAILRATDGGASTVRSGLYDALRGTTGWPDGYGGRGVINMSFMDFLAGISFEMNKRLYEAALKGDSGWEESVARLTTYAGTGVGLVDRQVSAGEITRRLREDGVECLARTAAEVAAVRKLSR